MTSSRLKSHYVPCYNTYIILNLPPTTTFSQIRHHQSHRKMSITPLIQRFNVNLNSQDDGIHHHSPKIETRSFNQHSSRTKTRSFNQHSSRIKTRSFNLVLCQVVTHQHPRSCQKNKQNDQWFIRCRTHSFVNSQYAVTLTLRHKAFLPLGHSIQYMISASYQVRLQKRKFNDSSESSQSQKARTEENCIQ